MLDFSDKNELQLWLEFLRIQSKKSLRQRLDFSDKKGLQLWSDLLKFHVKKIFETPVAFHREKWIATMVGFPSNSS